MNLSLPPTHLFVEHEWLERLYAEGVVDDILGRQCNEALVLKSGSGSALAIRKTDGKIHLLKDRKAFGVQGRNAEQRLALHLLLENSISIVSLGGLAGTGKSIIALAAAIESVLEQRKYKRVVVFRPLYPVSGQDLGYMPGDFDEKMFPWTQATWDAIDAFCDTKTQDYLVNTEIIEILPLTHLRGRTLSDSFIIIDEAQNLDCMALVTALTRVGEGSKVVLTHDINQRDNASVGRADGVIAVIERLMGHEIFAHINLHKVERSQVAKVVSELFRDL